MSEWISIDDAVPESYGSVLTYEPGIYRFSVWDGDGFVKDRDGVGDGPTHWMPLPEPPSQ